MESPPDTGEPPAESVADTGETPQGLTPAPFDQEIAAIFAEEAAELLEQADTAVGSLADGVDDERALGELQRYLHTLKGGARMAGLTVMGDFSHDLETLLNRVGEGVIARTAGMMDLLQASLDELHRLREAALTGMSRALTPRLGERLRAALRGEPLPVSEVPSAASSAVPPALELPPAAMVAESSEVSPEPGPLSELPQEPEPEVAFAAAAPAEDTEPPEEEISDEADVPDLSQLMPALDRLGELARELELPAARATDSRSLPPPGLPSVAAKAASGDRRDTARVDSALSICCSTMPARSASSNRG